MFQLHSGKYDDMLQAYKKLISVLEEERGNLQNTIANTGETMSGEAISSLQGGYNYLLNEGVYEEMLQQLRHMHWSFDDLQTLVGQIIGVGRTLGEQFTSDDFVESGVVASTGANYSIIEFDEYYTRQINAGCVEIMELGKRLKRSMDTIDELCGDLIDLTDAKEQFATAYTLSTRMDNFQLGFNRYVMKVRDLDETLRLDFKKLIVEEERLIGQEMGEISQKQLMASLYIKMKRILAKAPIEWTDADYEILATVWGKAVEAGDVEKIELLLSGCIDENYGTPDYAALCEIRDRSEGQAREILNALIRTEFPSWNYAECMVEVSKENGVLTILLLQDVLLEEDNKIKVTVGAPDAPGVTCDMKILFENKSYSAEYYEMAAEFLEKDETGAYKFEAILQQDAVMASATEQKVLALLFEDQFRVVETAPSREERQEYFDTTESFVVSIFRYQQYTEQTYVFGKNYVDQAWRKTLEEDILSKDSAAYELLKKLEIYRPVDCEEWGEGKSGKQVMDITITPQLVGMTLNVDFQINDSFYETEDTVLYVSSEARTIEYVDTLDEEVLEHLNELGYQEEQVIKIYMLADNVTDEVFIDQLMKAEYRNAFQINPENLGENAKYMLPEYAVKLCMAQDEDGQNREVEQFINAMLFQNAEYCEYGPKDSYVEEYINLMVEQSGVLKKNSILRIWEDSITQEEANLSANMDSLWRILFIMYYEDRIIIPDESIEAPYYPMGECLLQIKDLEIDSYGDIKFTLMLCNEPYTEDNQDNIEVYNDRELYIWPERDLREVNEVALRNRIKELDEKIENLWKEQTVSSTLDVLGIFSPELAAGLKMAVALVEGKPGEFTGNISNFELYEKYKLGEIEVGAEMLTGVYEYYEKREEWSLQLETAKKDSMAAWFYCVDKVLIDEEREMYLSRNISDYNVIQGIRNWNTQGCSWFVHDVMDDKLKECGNTNEAISKEIKTENMSEEKKEVLDFLIFGNSDPNHETQYESVLEIDDDLFIDCVVSLNYALREATGKNDNACTYWQEQVDKIGEIDEKK